MVAKLNNMSLRARMVVEGYMIGLHRSPYHGFSVEFAEHRAYGHGDEIRHIDWKLFGKTDRYYVKRFEEETNLRTYMLLDTSDSMNYGSGKITKLQYAGFLTSALAYLLIRQQDGIGLVTFDQAIQTFIRPRSTPGHLNTILSTIDNAPTGPDTRIGSVLHEMAERIKKRGLVVLVSDLLDRQSDVLEGLKHFRHHKQDVIVFHILDRQELNFDFNVRTRFRDMESGETLTTEPWHIRRDYQAVVTAFLNQYKKHCREKLIDYVPLFTDQPLDIALSEYLKKRQKLG